MSYDLVLGPLQSCSYDELLYNASAPVPVAANKTAFQTNRIRLRVGSDVYSIYQSRGQTRLVAGDTFQATAPPITPYSGGGTVDLIIGGGGPKMGLTNNKRQVLDANCGEYFAVSGDYVFFQSDVSRDRLYRMKVNGKPGSAVLLDPYCGKMVVPGDGYVYFQGSPGKDSLYRVRIDGFGGTLMDSYCGDFAVPGDGYVYFQGSKSRKSLFRMKVDGKPGSAEKMDPNCGSFVISGDYVYFQGNPSRNDLFRMKLNGKLWSATLMARTCSWMVVPGNGYAYFQRIVVEHSLYRMKVDGTPGSEEMLLLNSEPWLVAAPDGYIYFAGRLDTLGLYRMKADGAAGSFMKLAKNCWRLAVPGDGYVYYGSSPRSEDLCSLKILSIAPPKMLDEHCGNFLVAGKHIYYQGGPNRDALWRLPIPY